MTYFIARAHGTAERGFGKHEGEWTRKVEIRTMKKWTRKVEIRTMKKWTRKVEIRTMKKWTRKLEIWDNKEMD